MSSIQAIIKLIVKKDNKILILNKKSADGYISLLPGSKVSGFSQPEDISQSVVEKDLGITSDYKIKLHDILNYGDNLSLDKRLLVIIFSVDVYSNQKIILSDKYQKYQWRGLAGVNFGELDDLSAMILRIEDSTGIYGAGEEVDHSNGSDLVIFSDGGSRGNPGPSASAYILVKDDQVIAQGGEYIGITTNNQAEYRGVYLGLMKARELGYKDVLCKIDNMMVVNQMKGVYSVKNRDLWPIHDKMRELVADFDKVSFMHIKREFNVASDSLVNIILDDHANNNV